jgi:hypothetical protein
MTPAQLARRAALRGAMLFAALVPVVDARDQLWVQQFGTINRDVATAAAPDGAGGTYLCGSTHGDLGGPNGGQGHTDAWIAHHDAAGNQSWIRQLGTSSPDLAYSVAPDGAGGAYLSGYTEGNISGSSAGGDDAWLARYDSAGNQTWIQQFGTINEHDYATAVTSDGTGGAFVAGYTQGNLGGPSAGSADGWVASYDGAGSRRWIRQFGSIVWDDLWAIASDDAGGFYGSGRTQGTLGGPIAGGDDAWLARYDAGGNQVWIRQFGTSEVDLAHAAARDGLGGVFLSGTTEGGFAGPNAGIRDAWIAHYDGAGSPSWVRQLGSADEDWSYAAAADGLGGVYVTGATRGSLGAPFEGGIADAWLARYDSAGNATWVRQLGTSRDDKSFAAASDGFGGVFIAGYTDGNLGAANTGDDDVWLARYDGALVTTRYCSPATSNSTGQSGSMAVIGSNAVGANDITLVAGTVSLHSFEFFLTSRDQGNVFPVSNSQGRLCLGGFIGRYVGPGQVKNSGSMGTFSLALDLSAMAHPFSPVSAQPGQTWHFQAWHRDANPTLTSNFTDAVSVTFH